MQRWCCSSNASLLRRQLTPSLRTLRSRKTFYNNSQKDLIRHSIFQPFTSCHHFCAIHDLRLKQCNSTGPSAASESAKTSRNVYSKELTICRKLYQTWRSSGVSGYQNAPVDGLQVKASYFDSGSTGSEKELVVLAIHGAPGSHEAYDPITSKLTCLPNLPVRMVIPNFPRFELFEESGRNFRHSTDERADFMRTLLSSIGIRKVDLLMAHSSGIFPAMRLLDQDDIFDITEALQVRAVAMFNPSPPHWPKRVPWYVLKALTLGYENPLITSLMRRFNPTILPLFGTRMSRDKPDDPVHSSFCMIYSNYDRLAGQIERHLKRENRPCLLVYSGKDYLLAKEEFQEIEELMFVPDDAKYVYNSDGEHLPSLNPLETHDKESVYFPHGTHWAYAKESETVCQHLERMLRRLHQS